LQARLEMKRGPFGTALPVSDGPSLRARMKAHDKFKSRISLGYARWSGGAELLLLARARLLFMLIVVRSVQQEGLSILSVVLA
jgi:hypothetical protein